MSYVPIRMVSSLYVMHWLIEPPEEKNNLQHIFFCCQLVLIDETKEHTWIKD